MMRTEMSIALRTRIAVVARIVTVVSIHVMAVTVRAMHRVRSLVASICVAAEHGCSRRHTL